MKIKWQNQKQFDLTQEMIEEAKPHSIIHSEIAYIEHPWFNNAVDNLEKDGRSVKVKFVIYRGGIVDWCIYHSLDANFIMAGYLDDKNHLEISPERIASNGAKPHREEVIRSIVNCTDEVYGLYRH